MDDGPAGGRRQILGRGLAVGCLVLAVAGLVLARGPGGRTWSGLLHDNLLSNAVNAVTLALLADVLIARRPHNRLGWLVLTVAWCNMLSLLGSGWALASYALDLPGRELFSWLAAWTWAPPLVAAPALVPLLYPAGRTGSRFAHRLAVTAVATAATLGLALALLDAPYDDVVPGHHLGSNPISRGHLQAPLVALAIGSAAVAVLVAVTAWGHTLVRLRRARSPEREQLAWLLAVVAPLLLVAPLNVPLLGFAVQVLTPIGLVVGILAHQLFDLRPVLASGLVYGGLTALAVGAYVAVVASITTVTRSGTVPTLFAVATVGLVVVPAHQWMQRGVGRLVYGDRGDPLRALTRVTDGIRGSAGRTGAADVRPMVAGIARALRSPYVAVHDADGGALAVLGTMQSGGPLHEVPLEYAGEGVGRLSVAGRTPRQALTRADRALVAALAGPVAAAVRAGLMAQEVAESRARVLAVREGERRRLRNDLHDGLGPSLSGVALGLEAARASVQHHTERVPEILDVLHHEVESLVAEVRAIIDDLGPGDTDLVASLQGHIETVAASGGIEVGLSQTGCLERLPGEVAVAAQRIAGEAFTNAVRHAGASRIAMSVAGASDRLTIEVVDDGSGAVTARPGGVGLESMRRRAESVGGILTVDASPGRGTRVRADLPIPEEPA